MSSPTLLLYCSGLLILIVSTVDSNLAVVEGSSKNPEPIPSVVSNWHEVLPAVDSALDRLHFLATAIRKASAKRLEYNAATILTSDDTVFRRDVISLVKCKFPDARKTLCEQLGESIAIRRRMLIKRQNHSKKLAVRRESEATTPDEQTLDVLPSPQMPDGQSNRPYVPKATQSSAVTWASRPDPQAIVLRNVQSAPKPELRSESSSASYAPGDSFQYPDPPKAKNGQDTRCSHCLERLKTSSLGIVEKEHWR